MQYLLFIIRPTTGRIWHKGFLRWVQSQGKSPHTPGIAKNTYVPVGIPLIREKMQYLKPFNYRQIIYIQYVNVYE